MKIKIILAGMSMTLDNVKYSGISPDSDQLYSVRYIDQDNNDRCLTFPLRELVYMSTSEPIKK